MHKKHIIIGAGQAGLSIAYYLDKNKEDFLILERDSVASTWKKQYDSLTLITPNPFISLAGKKFNTQNKFPTKNEVVNYLKDYSTTFADHIVLDTQVLEITQEEKLYRLTTNKGTYHATNVIVASGYNGDPFVPNMAKDLNDGIIQYHSSTYKSLDSLPEKTSRVAVIGSGNSGIAIAKELSKKHNVSLFEGNIKRFPRKILGIDIFWWVGSLGLFKVKRGTFLGDKLAKKLIPKGDPTYGYYPEKIAKKHNIKLFKRLVQCNGNILTDQNEDFTEIDAVVWATGFRTNYHKFIKLNVFDSNKQVQHFRGTTSYDGLYFLGLKWQSNISSFLIFGVKEDAKYIYKKLNSKRKKDICATD